MALPISPDKRLLTAWACRVDGLQGAESPTVRAGGLEGIGRCGSRRHAQGKEAAAEKLSLPLLGGLWEEATVLHLLELAAAYFQIQHLLRIYYVPKE